MKSDGITNKYAIVINGDGASDKKDVHLKRVEESLAVLNEKDFETYVFSPETPKHKSDHYDLASIDSVQTAVSEIQSRIDGDDELLVYITGHGELIDGEEKIVLQNQWGGAKYLDPEVLDIQGSAKRVVVMDQCTSGGLSHFFVDDRNTLFVSSGNDVESVVCADFSPHFWANPNKDMSWQERFAQAMEHKQSSFPKFVFSPGFVDDGNAPFPQEAVQVSDQDEMDAQLKTLGAGQRAIVMFSATWCGVCKTEKPEFKKLAAEAGGQYLFLVTENTDLAKSYGVSEFPTVKVFESSGDSFMIPHDKRLEVLNEMTQLSASPEDMVKVLGERIANPDSLQQLYASLYIIQDLLDKVSPETCQGLAPKFRAHFDHENPEVQNQAFFGYNRVRDDIDASEAVLAIDTLKTVILKLSDKSQDSTTSGYAVRRPKPVEMAYSNAVMCYKFLVCMKLPKDQLPTEIQAFRDMVFRPGQSGSLAITLEVLGAYEAMIFTAAKSNPTIVSDEIKALSELALDSEIERPYILKGFFQRLVKFPCSSEDAFLACQTIRSLFHDPKFQSILREEESTYYEACSQPYIDFFEKLTPEQKLAERKALRELFHHDNADFVEFAMDIHFNYRIEGELGKEEREEGQKLLLSFADDPRQKLRAAVPYYFSLPYKPEENLSQETCHQAVLAFTSLIFDSEPWTQYSSLQDLEQLVSHMTQEDRILVRSKVDVLLDQQEKLTEDNLRMLRELREQLV